MSKAFINAHYQSKSFTRWVIKMVTFAQLGQVKIITDKLTDKKFLTKAIIKEVM